MKYVLHHRDADGFFAAAAAYHVLKDGAEYISVQYGEEFPLKDLSANDEVYIVDFSYSRAILDDVYNTVGKLVVLDHHKTAEAELAGTPYFVFDLQKCGSTLAWEFFRPNEQMKEIYDYVEDHDLYRHKLDNTKTVMEGLYLLDMSDIPTLYSYIESDAFVLDLVSKGCVLLQAKERQVDNFTNNPETHRTVIWENHRTVVYNTGVNISEIGHKFNQEEDVDMTISYFFMRTDIVFILRSNNAADVDVIDIALKYGGGGHMHAAGFKLGIEEGLALLSRLLI